MSEENRVHESEAGLQQERDDLRKVVRRSGWRRTQLLVMLLPFTIALAWTGSLFLLTLYEILRAPEPNLKALVETGFWGVISGLVVYVVFIVYRERRATVDRGFEAEKRLARVERRLQQRSLEEAAHAASGNQAGPPQAAPGTAGVHAGAPGAYAAPTAGHPGAVAGHVAARGTSDTRIITPAARPAPRSAPSQDRGQIVLDLDAVDTKECPMCAEQVRARAKLCRFCRYEFEQD
jgi:hypothetical protein